MELQQSRPVERLSCSGGPFDSDLSRRQSDLGKPIAPLFRRRLEVEIVAVRRDIDAQSRWNMAFGPQVLLGLLGGRFSNVVCARLSPRGLLTGDGHR